MYITRIRGLESLKDEYLTPTKRLAKEVLQEKGFSYHKKYKLWVSGSEKNWVTASVKKIRTVRLKKGKK